MCVLKIAMCAHGTLAQYNTNELLHSNVYANLYFKKVSQNSKLIVFIGCKKAEKPKSL